MAEIPQPMNEPNREVFQKTVAVIADLLDQRAAVVHPQVPGVQAPS